jgi:adenylate cyclase class 2
VQTEIEAKFLNADHDKLRGKLKELGARCERPMRLMRRKNYDFPDWRLEKIGGWVRVRDEGDKITLSYKQLNDRTLHGTKEVSLVVDNFKSAGEFLNAIGLVLSSDQESKRESWTLGEVQIELDEWPWINPFLEIEGPDEASVKKVAAQLGQNWEAALFGSVEVAYMEVYDVTEEEIDHWKEIKFIRVPDWLEAKRKKTAA